jgi:hypothetical protein
VPPGRLITGGSLWAGNPVKLVKELNQAEIYANYIQTFDTWSLAQQHINGFVDDSNNTGKEGQQDKKDRLDIDPNSLVGSYLAENYFNYKTKFAI